MTLPTKGVRYKVSKPLTILRKKQMGLSVALVPSLDEPVCQGIKPHQNSTWVSGVLNSPPLLNGVNLETWKLQLETPTWILVWNLKLGNCNLKHWPGSWCGSCNLEIATGNPGLKQSKPDLAWCCSLANYTSALHTWMNNGIGWCWPEIPNAICHYWNLRLLKFWVLAD